MSLPVGGREQPLLIVVDEAHRSLPEGSGGMAASMLAKVAKKGRKYGVGLTVVTQRPSDIDAAVLSQCGTMIALRVTRPAHKAPSRQSSPTTSAD
jgi:DNA helicase HerA-like ATPase